MITKEHIDALVALLTRDNQDALTESLAASIRRVAGHADVVVYELTDETGAREFSPVGLDRVRYRPPGRPDDPGRPLDEAPELLRAVTTDRMVCETVPGRPGMHLVFPVRGQRAIAGLLVIDCASAEGDTLYVIEALAHAWNSQQYLLERTERDNLTGLLNRHAFDRRLRALFGPSVAAVRDGKTPPPRCLALIDIDHFKEVNDRYGHLLGDEVLVQVARLLRGAFRGYDQLFRYGGEEFLVVLQHTTIEQGARALERFRQTVAEHRFPQLDQITVSIGLTAITGGDLPTTLLDRADKALYQAKQTGRNRSLVFEDLVARGLLPAGDTPSGGVELF